MGYTLSFLVPVEFFFFLAIFISFVFDCHITQIILNWFLKVKGPTSYDQGVHNKMACKSKKYETRVVGGADYLALSEWRSTYPAQPH